MVTVLAGAVAVGIVSVCAIPFGCFVTRILKRNKANVPPEVVDSSEPSPDEVVEESHYEIAALALTPRPNSGRAPRVRIRVLVANGSPKSMDLENQDYVTASGASESSSSGRGAFAVPRPIKARERISLPNPATKREIEAASCSLPAAIPAMVYNESSNRGLNSYSDTTRFEITISGGSSRSITQFGEFKSDVPDCSTPKSRQTDSAPSATDCSEKVENRSCFWRRASFSGNGPPKIFKATRDIEVINIEITPDDESHNKEKPCEPEAAATSSSQANGRNFDRGRWGLRGRFLETLKETTSFANL